MQASRSSGMVAR